MTVKHVFFWGQLVGLCDYGYGIRWCCCTDVQVGPNRLEPWDYDPRRNAEMSVDLLGCVEIIAPQNNIQVLCKLLLYKGQTCYAHIFLMINLISASCHSGTSAFPGYLHGYHAANH